MLISFFSGAVTFGFAIAALFFLRFWRRTTDPLFFWFGASFILLALGQALVSLLDVTNEERSWIFLLRLAAFVTIAIAILRKNKRMT